MTGDNDLGDDSSGHGLGLLQRLITQGIVPEKSVKSLVHGSVENSLLDNSEDTFKLLEKLVTLGLISSFQRRKIGEEGVDALRIGPYVLLDYVGKGGMGEVLRARHVELEREVALKMLPRQLTSSDERRDRFRREIRLLAKLDHPGIVKALDAGQWRDTPYLAMEFVAGGTLQNLLHDEGPVAWNRLIRWMIPVCDALDYAHAQGIVHRDIKPSNLAIDGTNHVKVLDLGLARAIQVENDATLEGFVTSTEQVLGTADFVAPEQAEGVGQIGPAADIYSLGCTFFTLLTGRPMYGGSTIVEKVMRHRDKPAPSVVELRPEVPRELEVLIQHMVAKSPSARPSNMKQVEERLTEIAQQFQLSDSTASDRGSWHPQPLQAIKKSSERTVVMSAGKHRWSRRIGNRFGNYLPLSSPAIVLGVLSSLFLALPLLVWNFWPPSTPATTIITASDGSRQNNDPADVNATIQPLNGLTTLLQELLADGAELELQNDPSGASRPLTAELLPGLDPQVEFAIHFPTNLPTSDQLDILAKQPGFVSASFAGRESVPVSIRHLAEAESLRELELEADAFEAADLVWLKECLPLRELTIHQASDAIIARVPHLTQLERLSLPNSDCSASTLRTLSAMKGLKELRLSIDSLNHEVALRVVRDLPDCLVQFLGRSEIALARWLLELEKKSQSGLDETRVRQMLINHQQSLLKQSSYEAYWALDEYVKSVDGNDNLEEIHNLVTGTLRINAQLLKTANAKQRDLLLEAAGDSWNRLAAQYLKIGDGRAVDYYQNSISAYQRIDASLFADRIAKRASSLALYFAQANQPTECRKWVTQTLESLSLLEAHAPPEAPGAFFWSWSRIGEALEQQAPDEAVVYLEKAHECAKQVSQDRQQQWHVMAGVRAARANLYLGRGERAAEIMQANQEMLEASRSRSEYPLLIRESLCTQAAIAILAENKGDFNRATDELSSLPGKVAQGALNYVAWDFISLRGWTDPFTEEQIQVESTSGGDWPSVARELAEGKISVDLESRLSAPNPDSSRTIWFQALKLRLSVANKPTEAQQAAATNLVALQAAVHGHWSMRAVVAGLLGPFTGPPLADISPLKTSQ